MPKSKPTQVIVHRIELQEKEREYMEKIVTAKEVESYAKGASIAAGAAAVGVATYITWWTTEKIYGWMGKAGDWLSVLKTKVDKKGSTVVTNPETGETVEMQDLGIFFPLNQWKPLSWLP